MLWSSRSFLQHHLLTSFFLQGFPLLNFNDMENGTSPFYFNFIMFEDQGLYRYLYFCMCLLLYIAIITSNIIIIILVSLEETLHKPMYFLISCLSINSLYGSVAFFPRFMMDLLSDIHLISRPACFTQLFVIYTYASYEFSILGIMAYDRYVAICQPLHYHNNVTLKICQLIAFALIYPMFTLGLIVYLSVKLPLCDNRIARVFCSNWAVVRLSCVDTRLNNAIGMLVTIISIFLPLVFVLYTYLRILLVCRKSSTEYRGKSLQTCLPHIVTFVNFSVTTFCEITLSRYEPNELNPFILVILSLEFVVIPPILNPLIYGLKLPEIRKHIFKLLSFQKMIS